MGEVCAPGVTLGLVCGVAMAAWVSGALFGWSLREVRSLVAGLTPIDKPGKRRGGRRDRADGAAARARRSGYYFSEETRSWGDGLWKRLTGWVLLTAVLAALTGSLLVAVLSYEPDPSQGTMTREP